MTGPEWRICIDFVLKSEGGFVDHPDDPGGATNLGISQRAHPEVNMRKLTRKQAERIYQEDYWDVCRCYSIDYPASLAVFDYAVNSGTRVATRALQRAVGTTPDGKIGRKTLAAIHRSHPTSIARHVTDHRLSNFIRIVRRRPASLVFLKGWMRRLMHLTEAFGQ